MAAPLMAEVASRWMSDGTAESLLAAKRAKVAAHQSRAAAAFAGLRFGASPSSSTCGCTCPSPGARTRWSLTREGAACF